MLAPPAQLDGADVLIWTASPARPYYCIQDGEISHPVRAMAICQYAGENRYYLFKCNFTENGWQVLHDWLFDSLEEAKETASIHVGDITLEWQSP